MSNYDGGNDTRNDSTASSIPDGRVRPGRPTDEEYLQHVERLANEVVDEACREGWLMYLPDDGAQTALQRSINELARNLRHVHFEGDGCLDHSDDEEDHS